MRRHHFPAVGKAHPGLALPTAPGAVFAEEFSVGGGERRAINGDRDMAQAPLQRSATPEDVAEVIMGLARATYVTGQVVLVDGGLSLR